MSRILKSFALIAVVLAFVACEEKESPQDSPTPEVKIELSSDKVTIVADGSDVANFTVEVDGVETNEGCKIVHTSNYAELETFSFSTTTPGSYTFVALYGNAPSNEVTIVATPVGEEPQVDVELSADISEIVADGESCATFTVKVDGVDVESGYTIQNIESGEMLSEPKFVTEVAGTYTFKALFGDYESNIVTITAKEVGEEPEPTPGGKYKPGDLYDVDGVKGVVFYVDESGESGLIMSMDQALLAWSTENVWVGCVSRGEINTEDMLKHGEDKYPAAKWCVDHGEGWYMPNSDEMRKMWSAVSNGKHVFDAEFIKLYNDKLDDPILEDYYWSSNEIDEDYAELVVFIDESVVCLESFKYKQFYVRAVHRF